MLAPQEFELPRHVEGGWIIGKYQYDENPRYTVPGRLKRLSSRWLEIRAMAAGGVGGMISVSAGPMLPIAGGYMEQPAFVMDAFRMFDRWAQERRGSG